MLHHAPSLDTKTAQRLARELYGVDGSAAPLTSERDQNFLITPRAGPHLVLKIANALEDPGMLDAQHEALARVAQSGAPSPRVVPTLTGEQLSTIDFAGKRHAVWAVSHMSGRPLALVRWRSDALHLDLGAAIGTLSACLSGFDHPAIHRQFHWDLARGRDVIAQYRPLVTDAPLLAAIDVLLERFDRHTAPLLGALRTSAIHNDLNDNNVLVSGTGDPFTDGQRVSGIVDFGDMVHGFTVGDLAIASAYAILGASDPLRTIANVVRGAHAAFPLQEAEAGALFGLMALRLCTSVCVAAHQRRQNPDNAYLDVSQEAIARTLPVLARIPFGLAHAAIRDACGWEPVAASARVRAWLSANQSSFASVLDADLRRDACTVLDLGIGSPLVSGDPAHNDEPHLTARVNAVLRARGATVAIGQYDEPRLLYTAPFFATGPTPTHERRTVHIGFDLFADAGTPVYAPIAGTVFAFADNHSVQDYGPVIVLRHETDDGTAFFTLYGHLSRESLRGKSVGQRVKRGEQIATFGTPDVNVGWTPHLHLQILTDNLELGHDFPGVAPASQRSVWRSISPDPNLIVGVPATKFPAPLPDRKATLARRKHAIGGNVSIAYRDPVRTVRGWKQYLFDDDGRRYIDAYNNVPHVGHAHPRVVAAAATQMSLLNTNTRYLSDALAEYADRLTATLPAPLSVCMFVNSASEANELALRMARAYTGRRDMLVLDAAYHGHTNALIDLSPYKHAGPGGSGTPEWVHVAPLPDDYRGAYRRADLACGEHYAADVATSVGILQERGRSLAGFIAETCPSVGGQLLLPPGYLAGVYRAVRGAGGVCIADEVQTGLGRIGTHFWAFEAHGVVPDIVVMGKPLGNGHPMAALVTTPAIAAAFDNGMEFFSTFGGNNVSCAVGLAVLDVMRDEGLQAHALRVGNRLLDGLRPLMLSHAVVGDVRGSGLFLGVELVRDRDTLEPAGTDASYVANRMREEGILLGTDGPFHNVVKIRPPLPFDDDDADRLVTTFVQILEEIDE